MLSKKRKSLNHNKHENNLRIFSTFNEVFIHSNKQPKYFVVCYGCPGSRTNASRLSNYPYPGYNLNTSNMTSYQHAMSKCVRRSTKQKKLPATILLQYWFGIFECRIVAYKLCCVFCAHQFKYEWSLLLSALMYSIISFMWCCCVVWLA